MNENTRDVLALPVRTTVAVAKGDVTGNSLVERDCIAGLEQQDYHMKSLAFSI